MAAAGAASAGDTEPPVREADIVPSDIEAGQQAAFVGSATDGGVDVTNPNLYNWTFTYNGSLVPLHGQTASLRFYTPGSYTITLQVDGAAGNRAWTNETLTVREKAAPEGPTSNTTAPGPTPGFEGLAAAAALRGAVAIMRRRRA